MKNGFMILLAVFPLCAQQPSAPPAVLRVFHEEIKQGKNAAHEKSETAFMQAAAKAGFPAHILGLTNITGTSQAVFLEQFDSFASIPGAEAILDEPAFGPLDAVDAELRTSQWSLLASYRPDLSYAASKANLPTVRFVSIETIRVRPGQEQKFEDLIKTLAGGAAKSGDTQPVATYEVASGAPDGTYLVLRPMESLKSMDEAPQRGQALFQAIPNFPQTVRELSETTASAESILFAVNPAMSYVPKEWVTSSPEFWGRKPGSPVTKAAATKQGATKAAK